MTLKAVTLYTDGCALGNPGPGGYGAVLLYGAYRKEMSGGFRRTTNNRMEILGVIVGLRALNEACAISVFSDSQYLVNAMNKGWARKWQANHWQRTRTERAANADLWAELLALCARHQVTFTWVRGHVGNPENERCDALANAAARQHPLPPDEIYERENGRGI